MRGVKDKTVQMLSQLGMSDNILTLIERRTKTDLAIFIGLCIFTLLFMYVLYVYVKPVMSIGAMVGAVGGGKDGVSEGDKIEVMELSVVG